MAAGDDAPRSLSKRLAWFVGLWLGGVVAVTGLAYLIRWLVI